MARELDGEVFCAGLLAALGLLVAFGCAAIGYLNRLKKTQEKDDKDIHSGDKLDETGQIEGLQ